MSVMTDEERTSTRAISKLAYCNPFLPERIIILEPGQVWS